MNPHDDTAIKRVIGVVSGKGGVGKSSVSAMMAVAARRQGLRSGILDADVTGPSIPRMFGIEGQVYGTEDGMFPAQSASDISIISTNLILENPEDPVVWRGPVIAGAVQQYWTDVIWGDLDLLFIDMPPGTGDVPLTVFQTIPVDGIVVVTSPQDLVSMIVEKALKMAEMMDVPVLGLVENMSYIVCPDCGKEIKAFGESHIDAIAEKHQLSVLAKIPMDPALATCCDAGTIETYESPATEQLSKAVASLIL